MVYISNLIMLPKLEFILIKKKERREKMLRKNFHNRKTKKKQPNPTAWSLHRAPILNNAKIK